MSDYMNEEYADIHLIYVRRSGNVRLAHRITKSNIQRDDTTFTNIDQRLRETGFFQITRRDSEQDKNALCAHLKQKIDYFNALPITHRLAHDRL